MAEYITYNICHAGYHENAALRLRYYIGACRHNFELGIKIASIPAILTHSAEEATI